MNNLTTQKNVKIVKNCVLLGAICLFCVWLGFGLCASMTASMLDLNELTPEESGGIPINYDFPDDKYGKFKPENKYVVEKIKVGELV